jgi:predicted ATPase
MLTKIIVEHFKCFKKLHLPLAPLTLLSGANATGKSTVLQALAILHQTAVESEWNKTLSLNASTISLGSVGDVIDKITGQKEFKIGVHSESFECLWTMIAQDRSALSVPIRQIACKERERGIENIFDINEYEQMRHLLPVSLLERFEDAKSLSSLITGLTYISAERLGPRETYAVSTPDQHKNVGPRGERTAWFLHYFADHRPLDGLLIDDFPPKLQRQTEAWMKRFFPGTSFNLEPVKGANLILLGIRTNDATDFHRPQNVGYGMSHILPVIVACLGAHQGELIMVENPEAHLHPSSQAAIGEFLARSAAAGIQTIIETHSDHVLNGVRRAVKAGVISHEKVAIHFFAQRVEGENGEHAQVISPMIDKNGNLDRWPSGFFDQYDKDLAVLIEWEG